MWIIEQTWKHVLFLHWKVDPKLIQAHIPFPLDLFEGEAVLSIVPFKMENIRFPFTPRVPHVSKLWEINLRTYVKFNGQTGIYFITLDTDSRLGKLIARQFFQLPYEYARISAKVEAGRYDFASQRTEASISLSARLSHHRIEKNELETWAAERYQLFTFDQGKVRVGRVKHAPWALESAELLDLKDQFSSLLPVRLNSKPNSMSYCPELQVRFLPFQLVMTNSL